MLLHSSKNKINRWINTRQMHSWCTVPRKEKLDQPVTTNTFERPTTITPFGPSTGEWIIEKENTFVCPFSKKTCTRQPILGQIFCGVKQREWPLLQHILGTFSPTQCWSSDEEAWAWASSLDQISNSAWGGYFWHFHGYVPAGLVGSSWKIVAFRQVSRTCAGKVIPSSLRKALNCGRCYSCIK